MTEPADRTRLIVRDVAKRFVLHRQGGVAIPVFDGLNLQVDAGDCVVLGGPSGVGKSTLMRMLYANYACSSGEILVRHGAAWVDMATAPAWQVAEVRRRTMGYVSQFLRVVPRVPTVRVVAEPAIEAGTAPAEAEDRARGLLTRLNLPEALWELPPATFSGGEQQRVNLARGFVLDYPVLLLDEPTASLDPANRAVVVELIDQARARGAAIVGIFHDSEVRAKVSTRTFDVAEARVAA